MTHTPGLDIVEGLRSLPFPWAHDSAQEIERLRISNAKMLEALKRLVADINEYERVNRLAPNPPRQECWDSVADAKAVIADAEGKS